MWIKTVVVNYLGCSILYRSKIYVHETRARMASDIPANNVHCTGVVCRYTHFLQPLRVNFTRTLRVFFTRTLCVFFSTRVFCACILHGNCVQYGIFTRMKRACNAAIPLASTVEHFPVSHCPEKYWATF